MARKKKEENSAAVEAPQVEQTEAHEAEAAEWFEGKFPEAAPAPAEEPEVREATDNEWFGVTDPEPAFDEAPEDMQEAQVESPEPAVEELPATAIDEPTWAGCGGESSLPGGGPVEGNSVVLEAIEAKPDPEAVKVVVKRHKDFLIYRFTKPEIDQAAQDLAAQVQEEARINVEKAQVNSQFGARLKKCQAEIAKFSAHVRDGQEHRYIDCETRFNDPYPGRKRTVRLDTFETISEDRMTYDERQQELPFSYPAR